MAYRPRPVRALSCAHCGAPFSAAHKSRQYCSSSCNTLAWRARRVLAGGGEATSARPSPPPPAAAEAAPALAFSLQNVGVIAAGAAMGQLAVQLGTHLVQELRRPEAAPIAGPAGWLPPAALAAVGPSVPVQLPAGVAWFTPLVYHGFRFYYSAALGLLFAEATDGSLVPITSAAQLRSVAPPEGMQDLINRYVLPPPAAPAGPDDAPEGPVGPG